MRQNVLVCSVNSRAIAMHNARQKAVVISLAIASIVCFLAPRPTLAASRTASDKFVRLANNYMKAGITLPSSDYASLAKYDVLVLPAEAQIFNPDIFATLRALNPDIVILAYV